MDSIKTDIKRAVCSTFSLIFIANMGLIIILGAGKITIYNVLCTLEMSADNLGKRN